MEPTRYIHLNKADFRGWPYSSYGDYIADSSVRDWIESKAILDLFSSKQEYVKFVNDYEAMQRERDSIKRELANG